MPDEQASIATRRIPRLPGWRTVLGAAFDGAMLAAAAELAWRVVAPSVTTTGIPHLNPHVGWLTPLAHLTLLAPATAAFALGLRLLPGPWHNGFALRTFAFTYAAAQTALTDMRLAGAAAVVLGLGLGVALARATTAPRVRRGLRVGTLSVGAAALAWAILLPLVRQVGYRQAMAGLPAPAPDRPNVLLLILDTVGSREMSLYGYHRLTTPVIDSLARHGVVFDRAIAPAPWTLPSHASIFTGRRATDLSSRFTVPFDDRFPVIAEAMASGGYLTAGFVANVEYTARSSGLARGFARYEDYVPSWSGALASTGVGRRVTRRWLNSPRRPPDLGRKDARRVNEEFLDWQLGTGSRPWFAFLNYYDAHDPYVPAPEDEARFLPQPAPGIYDPWELEPSDSAAIAIIRARHDAALFGLDRAIGELLDSLRRRGALNNTIIIVTSDHGEEWGENGTLGHGNAVYLPVLAVPLIIVHSGEIPHGIRVGRTAPLRRLAGTILSLSGIPHAEFSQSLQAMWGDGVLRDSIPGVVSWVELTRNQPALVPAARSDLFSLVDDSTQVIWGVRAEVYNTDRDPSLRNDLSHDRRFLPKIEYLRELDRTLAVESKVVSGRQR